MRARTRTHSAIRQRYAGTSRGEDLDLALVGAGMYGGPIDDQPVELRPADQPDRELERCVRRALASDSLIPRGAIRVKVQHGWVILKGEVDSRAACRHAVRDALETEGVHGVDDRVAVRGR